MTKKRIHWDRFTKVRELSSESVMYGEEKTLTEEEVVAINAALEQASQHMKSV